MILRSLHLENYKQYGRLDLEFRDGLVGVIGRNGAGKSTLFEAILYCLYGKDENNKNLIRSSFADPKAAVVLALQFAIGPAEYAVKREFRGKAMAVGAELYKNDQLIAKGNAVNDEVAKLLNMEREAFKRSVFSGQKELAELSDTKGEERKRMVRRMLGLDTLDEVQTRMNADARDLGNQIAGQRQVLLDPEVVSLMEADIREQNLLLDADQQALKTEQQQLEKVAAEHQTATQKFEAEDQRQKRYQSLQQEIGRLQERAASLREQGETLSRKREALQQQQAQLAGQQAEFAAFEADKKQLQQLDHERQRQLNRKMNLDQLDSLQEPLRATRARIETLDAKLAETAQVDQALQEKQARVAALEQEILQKREAFSQIKSKLDALQERMHERRHKIADLQAIGREGTCPTCFQPVLDAYDQVLAQLNSEIEAIRQGEIAALETQKDVLAQAGIQLRAEQEEARKEVAGLIAAQSSLKELARQKSHEEHSLHGYEAQEKRIQLVLREIGDVHFDEGAFTVLKTRVEATEPRYLQYTNNLSYITRELPDTQNRLHTAEKALANTGTELQARQAELAQTGYDAGRYESLKQALTQFAEAFSQQSDRVRALEKAVLERQSQIAQQAEKLRANADVQARMSAKLAEVELLKKLGELLLQFKTEVLEKISPSISREASDLFSRITKGKYERIHVDENFDLFIADGGTLYPIERFSGGEIDLANFCLRIAITKAIMDLSGNGQSVEFLAFDEIFGSQDEERRHEMMLALHYLQEQFRQIYIISHIDSQKDYFPSLLEVRYQPEGSAVKWV